MVRITAMIRRALVCALALPLPLTAAGRSPLCQACTGGSSARTAPAASGPSLACRAIRRPITSARPPGALWKTTSGGTTWRAVSDAMPVTGFGAVAVAPSQPGDRVRRHRQQHARRGRLPIGRRRRDLARGGARRHEVHHRPPGRSRANPDVVIAGAGAGGNFGSMVFYNNNPSAARGIYRTADGGRTWTHTLFVNDATSVVDVAYRSVRHRMLSSRACSASRAAARRRRRSIVSSDGGADVDARCGRTGLPGGGGFGEHRRRPEHASAQRLYALVGGRAWRRPLPLRRRRRRRGRSAPSGSRAPAAICTSIHECRRRLHDGHVGLPFDDGGKTLRGHQGGARRRRPARDVDRSVESAPDDRRRRPGPDDQPSTAARRGRRGTPCRTASSTTSRRTTSFRIASTPRSRTAARCRSEPQRLRRDPAERLVSRSAATRRGTSSPIRSTPRYVYTHGGGHVVAAVRPRHGPVGPGLHAGGRRIASGRGRGWRSRRKDPHWMFVGAQYVLASDDRVTWKTDQPGPHSDRSEMNAPAAARQRHDRRARAVAARSRMSCGRARRTASFTSRAIAGRRGRNVSPPRLQRGAGAHDLVDRGVAARRRRRVRRGDRSLRPRTRRASS